MFNRISMIQPKTRALLLVDRLFINSYLCCYGNQPLKAGRDHDQDVQPLIMTMCQQLMHKVNVGNYDHRSQRYHRD